MARVARSAARRELYKSPCGTVHFATCKMWQVWAASSSCTDYVQPDQGYGTTAPPGWPAERSRAPSATAAARSASGPTRTRHRRLPPLAAVSLTLAAKPLPFSCRVSFSAFSRLAKLPTCHAQPLPVGASLGLTRGVGDGSPRVPMSAFARAGRAIFATAGASADAPDFEPASARDAFSRPSVAPGAEGPSLGRDPTGAAPDEVG